MTLFYTRNVLEKISIPWYFDNGFVLLQLGSSSFYSHFCMIRRVELRNILREKLLLEFEKSPLNLVSI